MGVCKEKTCTSQKKDHSSFSEVYFFLGESTMLLGKTTPYPFVGLLYHNVVIYGENKQREENEGGDFKTARQCLWGFLVALRCRCREQQDSPFETLQRKYAIFSPWL